MKRVKTKNSRHLILHQKQLYIPYGPKPFVEHPRSELPPMCADPPQEFPIVLIVRSQKNIMPNLSPYFTARSVIISKLASSALLCLPFMFFLISISFLLSFFLVKREREKKKSCDGSQSQRKDCGAIARETNISNPRQQQQQSKIII